MHTNQEGFQLFQMGGNGDMFYNYFKGERERVDFIVVLTKQFIIFSQHIVHS